MKSYTVQQYINAECQELNDAIGHAIHSATGGKICDTGCHAFKEGKCPAYKKLIKTVKKVKPPKYKSTNENFARDDVKFIHCCELAGVKPSKRQASKWRNGKGVAFSKRNIKVMPNGHV